MSVYSILADMRIPAAWQDGVVAFLILLLSWVAGRFLSWMLGWAGHYFAQKARSELGDQVILGLRGA